MPVNSATFDATAPLPGGWRVVAFEPNVRLTLARAGKVQWRDVGRQAFVTATAAVLALALWGGTHQSPEFRIVLYPVLGLLGLVMVLGAVSVVRGVRRAVAGVHLAVDAKGGVYSGLARDSGLVLGPLSEVKQVRLHVHRGAGPNAKDPRAWARLLIELNDGRQLEAPESWGADEEWEAARSLLQPVSRQVAHLCGRPLDE